MLAYGRKESEQTAAGDPAMSGAAATPTGAATTSQSLANNTAPTATPSQTTPNQATGAISGSVNGSDVDPNTTLTYTVTGTPANGSVTVDRLTGAFTYTPTEAARLAAGQTAPADFDSFTVSVSDGQAATPVTISVAVLPSAVSSPTSTTVGTNPTGVAVSPTKTYVVNQANNTVSVIDRANPSSPPVTINVVSSPTSVAVSADSKRVYVAGNGGVSVIDTSTNKVIRTVSTGSGQLNGIAVSPDGQRVYATNAATNRVVVINPTAAGNPLVTTIAVGTQPMGLGVSKDGTRLYVANASSNSVSVINTSNNTVVRTITAVGTQPTAVVVSPDGSRVYVSNSVSNTVAVINPTATTPVVATIAVGPQPRGLAISPDGSVVYAANSNDTVSMINTKTNTVITAASVDAPGTGAHGIALSPDGRQIYVSDSADRAVRILTINRGNTAPTPSTPIVGTPDPVTGAVNVTLIFNDTDGDFASHSWAQPLSGTVTAAGVGVYTFTPSKAARDLAAGTPGPDTATFTITVTDTLGAATSVDVTVPVVPNRAPVAGTPGVSTPDRVSGAVTGALNFTDPDKDALTYGVPSQPSGGAVTVNAAGTYTFTPNQAARDAAANNGPTSASITVVASDGSLSTPVTFSVPISPTQPPNSAPTAAPTQQPPNQSTGAITGSINGSDMEGKTLSYTVTRAPANGTVELKPATGAFTYTPTQAARFAADMTMGADFDSFTVNVSDDVGPTPVTVKVAVLPARILNPTTSAQTGLTPMGVAVSSTKSYVANQGSNTVSVIDRANLAGTPVTINVVSAPRAIALSPDGTRAYVAGNGGVSVIDTATNQVIATVVTSAGDSYGIAVVQTGPNTQRVYVTNAANNTVRVINADTATNTYTAGDSVQVGSDPRGIAVSADGTRAYVANWASNSVSVLDTTTASVIRTITVGTNPSGVAVSPDGTRVYVSNYGSNSVSVLDPVAPNPLVTSIAVDSQPFGLAISPDGSLLYAANAPDTVSMITTKNNSVYSTLTFDPQPETGLHSIAVSPDGNQIFISDLADRRVRVFTVLRGNTAPAAGTPTVGAPAASNGAVTGALNFTDTDGDALTYSVQTQSPSGTVTVNAAGVYTFTPNQAARDAAAQTEGPDFTSFTVTASDGQVATPVTVSNVQIAPAPRQPQIPVTMTSIGVGDKPGPVAVFGNRLYVTNTSDGTVTVIDTTTNQVVKTLTATGGYPTALAASADGQRVYVAHTVLGPDYVAYNTVSVINTATNQVVKDVVIPDLCAGVCYGSSAGLTDLAVSPDGSRVYVIQAYGTDIGPWGSVAVIDTSDNSLIYNEFSAYSTDLEFTPDGTQLVYTQGDYRFVNISDFSTGQTPVAVVSTPEGGWAIPLAVATSPDSKRAYVVVDNEEFDYTGAKYVAVIDLDRTSPTYAKQIATITVPPGAQDIVVGPDGRAYVTHNGGESITVIDTATNTIVGYIDTSQIGGYYALAVAPNGKLYITDYADDVVYAVTVGNPPQV